MRSLEITLVVLCFCCLTTLFSMTGALPYVNTQATSHWDQSGINNMVITQNVTSSDMTGYNGYFTQGVRVLGSIFYIILGTCVVLVPICDLFGWSLFVIAAASAIQTICWALIGFDLLYLWRGISWRSG